jgi:peptide/nickel transport system substrate-binding protein
MKNKMAWLVLSFLTAAVLVLSSCAEAPTTTIAPSPTATTPAKTPAAQANWWDKFGEPEYGGTLIHRTADTLTGVGLDPAIPRGGSNQRFWVETLFIPNWAVDRSIFSFSSSYVPLEYCTGWLAESWEWSDPLTLTVHLRHGVHWQDKPPTNGREFTADDVVYTFDRLLGTGHGFTEPNPYYGSILSNVEGAAAQDRYTVAFKFKKASFFAIDPLVDTGPMGVSMVAQEWVELGGTPASVAPPGPPGPPGIGAAPSGPTADWHNVVGTGAWMLTDFVEGTSMTFSKNPNYWGYDARYPKNKLPYADTFKELSIPDMATTLAAMRTGKIDLLVEMHGPEWQQGKSLADTNPEIKQACSSDFGYSLIPRCDTKPFTDIRVRKALQMAIDRQTIAKTHYGGTVDGKPAGLISPDLKGWTIPYDQWPQDLKDEYSYNPTKAKELLAEAGYPDGFKTDVYSQPEFDPDLLQIVKSYFMDIGVDMEIRMLPDMPSFGQFAEARKHDQMVCEPHTGPGGSPATNLKFRTLNDSYNYGMINDPTYDALYNQLVAATNIEEAQRLSQEADMYTLQQHWSFQVCRSPHLVMWQPYTKGYSGENIAMRCFMSGIWIDQKLKASIGR